MRSLAGNFFRDEKIKTTEAKAKEIRPFLEKMITKGKTGDLRDRRLVSSRLNKTAAKKVFEKISPKCRDKKGGYTRIIKLPRRRGDAAKMAIIKLS